MFLPYKPPSHEFSPYRIFLNKKDAPRSGIEQMEARLPHTQEVVGSSPTPAIIKSPEEHTGTLFIL